MKKTILITAIMALTSLCASAAKTPAKTDTLCVTTTPQMHCSGCENRIKQNIRFVKGVKKIETSVEKQTVTIIYDKSKSSPADFTAAFKKIGYTITPIKK
ncbi:MAG: heavy-metal-associated domain-containing protein [Muribaculaceae bacterium]